MIGSKAAQQSPTHCRGKSPLLNAGDDGLQTLLTTEPDVVIEAKEMVKFINGRSRTGKRFSCIQKQQGNTAKRHNEEIGETRFTTVAIRFEGAQVDAKQTPIRD